MIPVETFPRKEGSGRVKENGGLGKFVYDIFDTLRTSINATMHSHST
jgi:hypothetical protein